MLIFPENPVPGQTFSRWYWDGEKWTALEGAFEGFPSAPTAPMDASDDRIATTAFVMRAITHHIAGGIAGVASFNVRTGHVVLILQDIVDAGGAPNHSPHFTGWPEAETAPIFTNSRIIASTEYVDRAIHTRMMQIVDSFNGRHGDVVLTWQDLFDAGAAPRNNPNFIGTSNFAGTVTGPNMPAGTNNTSLATTFFVNRAIVDYTDHRLDDLKDDTVWSFNGRKHEVEFRPSDLSAVGGAFRFSESFTGEPRAPTPPPADHSERLATTEYVDRAIHSNPGPPGAPGAQGPQGPQGIGGEGLRVLGEKPTHGDLPLTGNHTGDVWMLQTPPGEGWWWNGSAWMPMGAIAGAEGPRGPPGGIQYAGDAPTAALLPMTGNQEGDLRITLDDGQAHVWDQMSGTWIPIGPFALPDAPSNGQFYARRNGVWVAILDDGVF